MSRPKLWTRDQVCPDAEETVNKLRRVMNILYSFYDCDDLKFNKTDPTMEHYSNTGLYKQRQRLLITVVNECREALSGSIV